jgi:hypothetical protein
MLFTTAFIWGPIDASVANVVAKIFYFLTSMGHFVSLFIFSMVRYLFIFHSKFLGLISEKSIIWVVRGSVIFLTCLFFLLDLTMNTGGGVFYTILRNQPSYQ